METHVWQIVRQWMEGQQFPPSQAAVARYLGVNRSAVSQWKKGQAQPTPDNLRAMATMTGVSYERFLDALLRDQGYLRTETYDAAATMQAPGSGAGSASDSNVTKFPSAKALDPTLPDDIAARDEKQTSKTQRARERQDREGES